MNRKFVALLCRLPQGLWICALVLSLGTLPAPSARADVDAGVIAFVTSVNGREDQIRLIDPTGENNRLLWSTGDRGVETQLHYVANLAWKPDGSELAFHSSHEAACSLYGSDIYGIRANGTNYRRIVSPPACGQNPGLPTGTVQVTYYNMTSYSGPFVLYIEGAPGPQSSVIPAYSSLTVTFANVIDYGSRGQAAVAATGVYRYVSVEGHADVIPGQTVQASVTMSMAYRNWLFHSPTWNYDGTQLAYLFGSDIIPFGIAADNTTPGLEGTPLLTPAAEGTLTVSSGFLAYGPAQAVANQLLYIGYDEGSNIYRITVGQSEPGEILVTDGDLGGSGYKGLAWLPDGSGFIFSMGESFGEVANIFRYSFATQQTVRLTEFSTGWTRRMAVSPDGSRVVFEYQSTGEGWDDYAATDLYTMNIDGTGQQLLVAGGRSPAWGITWQMDDNPVPALASLNPSVAISGGPGFTLTVQGSNFISASVVRWNGVDLATTLVSPTVLTAQVPAAQTAGSGTARITVYNPAPGGGESGPLFFTINGGLHTLYLPTLFR